MKQWDIVFLNSISQYLLIMFQNAILCVPFPVTSIFPFQNHIHYVMNNMNNECEVAWCEAGSLLTFRSWILFLLQACFISLALQQQFDTSYSFWKMYEITARHTFVPRIVMVNVLEHPWKKLVPLITYIVAAVNLSLFPSFQVKTKNQSSSFFAEKAQSRPETPSINIR